MNADLEDFKTGWYGLTIGLKAQEIDELIRTLEELKKYKSHFHFRSDYEGDGGIGDIEVYFEKEGTTNSLSLESSCRPHDTGQKS
jgi:hypothetical protein